jgi:hypothetical protein
MHKAKPVGDQSTNVLCAFNVAMHDDRKKPASEMSRLVPSRELELLRLLGVLAVRTGRVRISAIGADEAIHHQLQWRRDLILVHQRDDHDPMCRHPHRIDLVFDEPMIGSRWGVNVS